MEKEHFLEILSKIQDRTASREEQNFYEAYDQLFDLQPDGLSELTASQVKHLEKQISAKVNMGIGKRRTTMSILRGKYGWWAAASFLMIFSAALVFYQTRHQPVIRYIGAMHTIPPSSKGPVLTLANGQRIDLTEAANGLLATEGTTHIAKTATGEIRYSNAAPVNSGEKAYLNSIVTPRGSIAAILLPDGSRAYLNAGSSLHFPAAFSSTERSVELSGEAEFEVVHQPSRPFVVRSAGQKVQVLGTHFNINAYPDNRRTNTTLISGRVALSSNSETRILKPGQQGSIGVGQIIDVRQLADPADALAWRYGIFHFENSSIQEVMGVLSLWYDVDIVVESGVRERLFSGDIHKTLSLEKVLKLLNYQQVYFEINGRYIRVST